MGAEKVGSKSGGFFHLFDWNRKSRKKLFASVSPEGTKQARKSYDSLPASNLRLLSDDDIGATFSIKASSDYSCASSVTDEEGNGIRPPGVVARLMGLDTMPMAAGVSEPYSSPLYEFQSQSSMVDRQYQKSSIPVCEINNSRFICMHNGTDVYTKKVPESKVQRMPSSPIERFKTEMLPPRSAKSLSSTHLKLLSPIRNPISPKDAANIMEAAAKILEPGIQASPNVRVPSIGPPSIPFRIRDPKETPNSQSLSRILESSKRPVKSNSMKYLRGKPVNRNWNCSESDTSCRASPEMEDNNLIGVKGKSISLAIQAKVNVQRREGMSPSNTIRVNQKQSNEIKESRPFKSQVKTHRDRLQKKASAPSTASGVLKQNNQKQNSLASKDRLSPIPSASSSQGRKAFSGEAFTSVRTRPLNKPQTQLQPQGISKGGCRRKGSPNLESVVASSTSRTNHLYRKKRLIEVDYDSEKRGCDNNSIVGRQGKRIQHNIVFDEQLKQSEDTRKSGMDVVTFTFTSSTLKPFPGSQTVRIMEKQDAWDFHHAQVPGERNAASSDGNKLPAIGLNMTCGDSLSILLDQKLRELTMGFDSPSSNLGKVTSQDPSYASESSSAMTVEQEKDGVWEFCTDNDSSTSDSGLSSVNGQTMLDPGLKETEVTKGNSISGTSKESELHTSPYSVFEPSFSYESCISLESFGSASGINTTMDSTLLSSNLSFPGSMKSSYVLAQDLACFDHKLKPSYPDVELEVSDSASSSFRETTQPQQIDRISRKYQKETTPKWEVEYVNEILSATKLNSQNFAVEYRKEILNSPIFEQLENKKYRSTNKSGRGKRKLLFHCVRECLDLKIHRYFNAGYETWGKGVAVVCCGEFAEEIFKEISAWSGMGDCMVDELVYKDMSSHQGRWLDFENDEFGTGGEIGNEILATLIDEVIAELKNIRTATTVTAS